jgi:ABC-type polysaccharide/polyol phosphate export permease
MAVDTRDPGETSYRDIGSELDLTTPAADLPVVIAGGGGMRRQIAAALDDFWTGAARWRLWTYFAWQDIKQRYRRSTLGPVWLTLSMGIQILTMGLLVTWLMQSSYERTFPFVCSGLVLWALVQGIVIEGSATFVSAARFFLQVRHPFSVYLAQMVWRNVIVAAHNFVIYIVVAIIYMVVPDPIGILLFPVALVLVVLCVSSFALIAAVVSARFRDFPMILTSILQVLFWLTPIIYMPAQLGRRRLLVEANPFTHMVAIMRDPLLGNPPDLTSWLVVVGLTIVGWAVAFLFFARFRSRIVYWM